MFACRMMEIGNRYEFIIVAQERSDEGNKNGKKRMTTY